MNVKNRWFSRAFLRGEPVQQQETKMSSSALNSGFVALQSALSSEWTTPSYGALSNAGFMKNPIVHRCVRMISEAAGALPVLLFEKDAEIDEHQALTLLAHPNIHQTKRSFIETICGHLLLSGNAFIEQTSIDPNDLPAQLFAVRPDRVTCEVDVDGWPNAYKISGATQRTVKISGDDAISPILHLKLFHPLDDQNGFAPLNAALMALDTHNSAASWNKALLDNAARPSGALVYAPNDGSNLTSEQFDSLKRELEEGYSGANNAGKPMLLEGGLDWKSMGLSPKDMDFVEMKNGASRDIALAFGVPPMLLGIPGDNTYSNYQEANRAFFRLTVLPMMSRIIEALTDWLSPLIGPDYHFELDLDRIESLSNEREALWSCLQNTNFLTDDEKRIATGYSPLEKERAS